MEKLLEHEPYFENCYRERAVEILNRVDNPNGIVIFMVRKSSHGGFAITLKIGSKVHHIRIKQSAENNNNNSNKVCITPHHEFSSVQELVNFYTMHSLLTAFNLDSKLGVPFKQLIIPKTLGEAVAVCNYNPAFSGFKQMKLKSGEKYLILRKSLSGWWKVYNKYGQIGYVPHFYLNKQSI